MHFRKIMLILVLIFTFQFAQAQCWNLVWEEEFTGTSLNANNWSYESGNWGWGNNELQYYREGTNNVSVSGGTLKITAKEESYMGSDYTSARIRTINKSDWTHGKMEARIKLPEGQGIWPACWMLPTDNVFGGWPNSGEIDIMEYLGHQTNVAHGTVHYSLGGTHTFVGDSYVLPSGNYNDAFHTFTIEWESGAIRWYVDGFLYHSVTEASLGINPWVFDEKFHFILNLAVGGNWPGNPDASTVFPQTMEVDYVRVYQQLSEIEMTGETYVQPGEEGIYTVPFIAGATYHWTVPNGATILGPQGTNLVIVRWGANSGDITCEITTACGTQNVLSFIEVNPNLFINPAFENDFANWNTPVNGGAANFSISTLAPQEGTKAARVEVSATGANPWDIQLQRSGITLEAGVTYDLSFWAKSETAGLVFPVFFVKNQAPWTPYGNASFTTSLDWTKYTYSFTPSLTDDVFFNVDLGSNLGVFYFDDFIFGENIAPLPIELGAFSARQSGAEEVLLEWSTYAELNNDYFEVFKSLDGLDFASIGKVAGAGNVDDLQEYEFVDKAATRGMNYYQLRQVDFDGAVTSSQIQAVEINLKEKVAIYPNPVKEDLVIEDFEGGEILIVNLEGKVVFKGHFDASEKLTLDLSELEVGLYLLQGVGGVFPFFK